MSSPIGGVSPIEVLLPRGRARETMVLGSCCPSTLVPAASSDGGQVDLIVVAPSKEEAGLDGWIARSAAESVERLGDDGIVYLLAAPRARAAFHRALRARGLELEASFLHLPGINESRLLVPLERAAANHAFARISPLAPWKRMVASALLAVGGGRAIAAIRGNVGLAFRRKGARRLVAWVPLPAVSSDTRRDAIVSRSPRVEGSRIVVHPFAAGSTAPVVAKLKPPGSADSEPERPRLERIGSTAAQAGAAVPTVVGVVETDGAEFTLETRLGGQILAPLLNRDPDRLAAGFERVCAWLADWSRLTATATRIDRDRLEREVLTPARALAPVLADGAYLRWLERRCDDLVGTDAVLTASHNDLSMWNVLVDGDGIGVIDWESAEDSSLPLKDFFYAAVDAVVAADRTTRRAAVEACFGETGARAALIGRLQAMLADAIAASPAAVELSFHSCWLKHGAYEARKHPEAGATPFRDVVDWLAVRELRGGAGG